jgi:hypothetical protein
MIVTSISVLLFLPRELIRSPDHNAIFKRSTAGTSGGPVSLFPRGSQNRFTAERVLRTRPKTYRAIMQLLGEPDAKVLQIAKLHRVSEHTVCAIRKRESVAIAERKQRLISIFGDGGRNRSRAHGLQRWISTNSEIIQTSGTVAFIDGLDADGWLSCARRGSSASDQ